jgi:hypothetical protein
VEPRRGLQKEGMFGAVKVRKPSLSCHTNLTVAHKHTGGDARGSWPRCAPSSWSVERHFGGHACCAHPHTVCRRTSYGPTVRVNACHQRHPTLFRRPHRLFEESGALDRVTVRMMRAQLPQRFHTEGTGPLSTMCAVLVPQGAPARSNAQSHGTGTSGDTDEDKEEEEGENEGPGYDAPEIFAPGRAGTAHAHAYIYASGMQRMHELLFPSREAYTHLVPDE